MDSRKLHVFEILTKVDGARPESGIGKHRKMAANPFLFFRGSAPLFYADIANGTLSLPPSLLTLPLTTVMGDCHTSNFGFLTEEGSHGDHVIFSANDFDDACIGHAVWDMARFIVSQILCRDYCQGLVESRYRHEKNFTGKPAINEEQTREAIAQFLKGYQLCCHKMIDDEQHRYHVINQFERDHILSKRYQKALSRSAGGDKFEAESTLAKALDLNASPLRFNSGDDELQPISEDNASDYRSALAPYVDDCILDMAIRHNAGTGSVNMSRLYLLVGPEGASREQLALCHIVEIKQQRQAAPLSYFSDTSPVNRLNPAHLTVNCQRRMQRNPDLVLDELAWQGAHWLIRSRHHAKVGVKPEHIGIGKKATKRGGFSEYGWLCGTALALAHGRGDRRSTLFEQAVIHTLSTQADALISACYDYAELVVSDCQRLREALPPT